MLCLFIYSTVAAQMDVLALLAFLLAIAGTVVSIVSVKQSIKKAKEEHEDKFASRELLNEKIIGVNMQIMSMNKEIDELKKDNQREHDQLKKDFNDTVNRIWDWIQKRA